MKSIVVIAVALFTLTAAAGERPQLNKGNIRKAVRALLKVVKEAPDAESRRATAVDAFAADSELAAVELIQQIEESDAEDFFYLRGILRDLECLPETLIGARLRQLDDASRKGRLVSALRDYNTRAAFNVLIEQLEDKRVAEALPTEIPKEGNPRRVCDIAHDTLSEKIGSQHFPPFAHDTLNDSRDAAIGRLKLFLKGNLEDVLKNRRRN